MKEAKRREIYKTNIMKYLTFLDYSTLETTGKNIEAKLNEKDKQIQILSTKYDEDIKILKDAVADMRLLLKNPQKLIDLVTNPNH